MAVGVRDEHELRAIGETIRKAIEAEPIVFGDANGFTLTVSTGGALADTATTPSELIEQADLALYAAKRRGRNQVRLGGDLRTEPAPREPHPVRRVS